MCPPRQRPLPSGPAQTARGAGRSLPACFSFRANPGCSPDIPEGTSRRQSCPGLGKPGCRQPRGQNASQCFSLPCLAFFKLLNPSRSLVHSLGALTLAFEANNENDEADQAGLLLCPVLSWVSPPLHLCSGRSPPPETGLPPAGSPESSWERRPWNNRTAINYMSAAG